MKISKRSLLMAATAVVVLTGAAGRNPGGVETEYQGDLGPQGAEQNTRVYGYGTADAAGPLRVGDQGTWSFTYHVGSLGVDDGGRIWLLTHIVSDWALQTENPKAANYVSATTSGQAKLRVRMDRRNAGSRPYWGGVEITVRDGNLAPGDTVTVTIGDRSQGAPGALVPQIVPNSVSQIRFVVDPLNNATPVRVRQSPALPIVAGPPVEVKAVWPAEVKSGGKAWLLLKVKDQGGNVATGYRGRVNIDAGGMRGLPSAYTFTARDGGVRRFEIDRVPDRGSFQVKVADPARPQLSTRSNVLSIVPKESLVPFCGDLHGQHNVGSSTARQYALSARDHGSIDFMSWAVNDFHLTEANWRNINRLSKDINEPGRFVVFPGYEYSATSARGGDHNVIFLREGQSLHRSGYVEHDTRDYDPTSDRYNIEELTRSLDPEGTVIMPHIGGRRANLDEFDPNFMHFIEIYSDHGQFEWFLREALDRKLKVGFVASSDDAFGKLGDSPPGGSGLFTVHGGQTCVYAERLDRPSLWDAFKKRRVYATTGERIQLRFRAGDHWMGEEIRPTTPPTFSVQTSGTQPIDRVEFYRDTELVTAFAGSDRFSPNLVKIVWRGAASKERARQTLWQGDIAVSGNEVTRVSPYRLDQPLERVEKSNTGGVEFNSVTAGDEDGVIVELKGGSEGVLKLRARAGSRNQFGELGDDAQSVELSVNLSNIPRDGLTKLVPGIDRSVMVSRVRTGLPWQTTVSWTDKAIRAGTHAYWVKVIQADGGTAWSSPIFVTR